MNKSLRGFSHIAERLPQHCEYRSTYYVVKMKCFLTTFCGNIVATFLKLSWNMLQQLNLTTFSQLPLNVVETLLQPLYC